MKHHRQFNSQVVGSISKSPSNVCPHFVHTSYTRPGPGPQVRVWTLCTKCVPHVGGHLTNIHKSRRTVYKTSGISPKSGGKLNKNAILYAMCTMCATFVRYVTNIYKHMLNMESMLFIMERDFGQGQRIRGRVAWRNKTAYGRTGGSTKL